MHFKGHRGSDCLSSRSSESGLSRLPTGVRGDAGADRVPLVFVVADRRPDPPDQGDDQ
jgi:hypothetical protein